MSMFELFGPTGKPFMRTRFKWVAWVLTRHYLPFYRIIKRVTGLPYVDWELEGQGW